MLLLTDRSDFTLDSYRRVAWEGEPVEVGQDALERIAERRSSLERLVENNPDRHYYGTTTTPGEGVKTVLTEEQRRAFLDQGLTNWVFGDPVPQRVARGVVFARLINLIEGHAGVRRTVVEAVAACLDGRELVLPSRGHLWEIGVPGPLYEGLVERVGRLEMKEPNGLSNGCPAATALLCDLTIASQNRFTLALQAMALGAEALLAPHEHYLEEVGELWGDEDEKDAMARLRELLQSAATERRPYQAPVSFRIIPRMLGVALRSQHMAEKASTTMLRAVSHNPVYVPPAEGRPDGDIWSTGGYHPAQAIQAMDGLAYAWANLCQLCCHQSVRLATDDYGLQAKNATGWDVSRSSGGMASAAWAYEMAQLAQPTLLPLTGSGQTDAGSMSFAAWRKATEIGRGLDALLAGVSVTASEIYDLTGRPVPAPLHDYLDFVRGYRAPNGSPQTIGKDVGSLANAITARVYEESSIVATASR